MTLCPCCSDQLLRHVRQSKIYWFCPNCRQEMPIADLDKKKLVYLPIKNDSSLTRC